MTRTLLTLTLVSALGAAGSAAAAVTVTDRARNEFPISPTGVVVIHNQFGNIQVSVTDEPRISIVADRVIRGLDDAAVADARRVVHRIVEGNQRTRFIRTSRPLVEAARWKAHVNYAIVMPRTAHLKIVSQDTESIRVTGLRGNVSVENMNGPVLIENLGGPVQVENTNGDITLTCSEGIAANARLVSINGSIVVHAPANASFIWDVDTVVGEALTSFPVDGGKFITATRFRGSINAPANLTMLTHTFKGNVLVLSNGSDQAAAQRVSTMAPRIAPPSGSVGPRLDQSSNRRGVQRKLVPNAFTFKTTIGDVRIDEIRGAANIATGAGEVNLGTVFGHCDVFSNGGPLGLGDIIGRLKAKTAAGNVTVQRARTGGSVTTGGGTVLVHYAGGPMQLTSGGGDIVVRQALGAVTAETRSGDIAITIDIRAKNERIVARTEKGNVVLTIPTGFGADVDALVITSDPRANSIRSDVPGLSIQREQVGDKTRIRATGKLNGGGPRIELQAQDGGIHIVLDVGRVSPTVPIR